MDKNIFAKYMATNLAISPKHANLIIDAFTENLGQAIFEGHSVDLEEFGSFLPTKKLVKKHVYSEVKFLPGNLLKDKIA